MSFPSKQTLGFATRAAAVQAMKDQGLTRREIAERLGITMGAVSGHLHYFQRKNGVFVERADRPSCKPYQQSPTEYDRAKAAGILFADQVKRPVHRETDGGERRELVLHLTDETFARIVEDARALRMTPAALARRLVEAALQREAS